MEFGEFITSGVWGDQGCDIDFDWVVG